MNLDYPDQQISTYTTKPKPVPGAPVPISLQAWPTIILGKKHLSLHLSVCPAQARFPLSLSDLVNGIISSSAD